jgi:hypothetical protein
MAKNNKYSIPAIFYPSPRVVVMILLAALFSYGGVMIFKKTAIQKGWFKAEVVKVTGNKYLDENEIKKIAKIDSNQSLLSLNLADITDKLLENPYLKGVSVARVYPNTVRIDVQEREPKLYLIDRSVFMVDESGVILPRLPKMKMSRYTPVITGVAIADFKNEPTLIHKALEILDVIKHVDPSILAIVSEIHFEKDMAPKLVLINGGANVVLGTAEYYQKIYLFSELLKQNAVVEKLPSVKNIDLTFADRVIVQNKS